MRTFCVTTWCVHAGARGAVKLSVFCGPGSLDCADPRQAHPQAPTELEAFREHNVIVFVLSAGNASAAETADLVARLYDKIQRLAAQAKPPVMYSVTRSGVSKPIKFK